MSDASYTAWDDNLYEWPPPDGWYEASDGRWWPQGYGPPATHTAGDPGRASSGAAAGAVDSGADGPGSDAPGGSGGTDPAPSDPGDLGSDSAADNGTAGVAMDPDRTSVFPAGGFPTGVAPVTDRAQEETPRRVYDELPPIDDVFGGEDPYSTETASDDAPPSEEPVSPPGHPAPPADDPAPRAGERPMDGDEQRAASALPEPTAAPAMGPAPAPVDPAPAGGERPGGFDLPPRIDDDRAFDTAFDRVADSLRVDPGETVFAPTSATGHPDPGPSGPPDPGPDQRRPQAEPAPAPDLDATRITDSPFTAAGPDRNGPPAFPSEGRTSRPDDSATSPIDLAVLFQGDERAASPTGSVRGDLPPSPGSGFELSDDPGGYASSPALQSAPPRRWWPIVVIGAAVALVLVSVGAFLVFRGDGSLFGGDNGDGDANGATTGPGSFDEPYAVGTGVVVFYDDDTSGEQRRWVIQVLEPATDATDELVDDGAAEAPDDGEILARARIRVTYQRGPEPGNLADLQFNAAGTAGTRSDLLGSGCSEPLDTGASLAALESAEGDVCWQIPASELEDLRLAVEAGPAAGTVHLALG